MDSRQQFFATIYNYYISITGNQIPEELLNGLCHTVTEFYYEQYSRFGKKYPKSIKRYSSFQLNDLNHPYTKELVIKYLKEKTHGNYADYAVIALEMTIDELKKFEKNREDFWRMF